MKYFATLTLGGHYSILTKAFDRGVETAVTKEEYDYLSSVVDKRLVTEGNGVKVVSVNKFSFRVEEPTKEEAAEKDIEDAPDKLAPKKPAR